MLDAIRIATHNPAAVLGIDERTGSISVGKDADLSIVDGDIMSDLSAIENTILVMKRGKTFHTSELLKQAIGKITLGR